MAARTPLIVFDFVRRAVVLAVVIESQRRQTTALTGVPTQPA
jgi:hypothetical protein